MSLPYPSMVFVPLDILTAEEMNQLVANIESLSAGTGLADVSSLTTDTDVSVGSAYTFVPISGLTLTPTDTDAGARLLVDVSLALKAPAGSNRDRYIRVFYNGQNYGGCGVSSDAGDWVCVSALALIPYNGSGTIEIQLTGGTAGTYQILSRSTAVAFRV